MSLDDLSPEWEIWNREPTKVVLTYRPDVFNTEAYPAPCLPTIHIRRGKRSRRPGRNTSTPDDPWYVTLYLEPDVSGEETRYESQEAAITAAIETASAFAAGDIGYRSLYQVPRPDYLDRLDELTGRS